MDAGATASKQERTYLVVRQRILDGTYGPGSRLVIDAIARELQVSHIPVREALRRLEAEGWVRFERNHGPRVTPIDLVSWFETMTTVAVLEAYATSLSAPFMRPADVRRLRAVNEEIRVATKRLDGMTTASLNQDFHEGLCQRCPNASLLRGLRAAWKDLFMPQNRMFLYLPARGDAWVSADEHEKLISMVETGAEPRDIEELARRHKLRTIEAYGQLDIAAAPEPIP